MSEKTKRDTLSRREFMRFLALGGSSLLFATACKALSRIPVIGDLSREQPATPTLKPPAEASPSAPPSPEPIVEAPAINPESIGGYLERDEGDPRRINIRLTLPQDLLAGESPIIAPGETIGIVIDIDQEQADLVRELSLSWSEIFDIESANVTFTTAFESTTQTNSLGEQTSSAHGLAQRNNKILEIDDPNNIIGRTEIRHGTMSNGDIRIHWVLPNESIGVTDTKGQRRVNPAQRFASGQAGTGIRTTQPISELRISAISIANAEGEIVRRENLTLSTPETIKPDSSAEEPSVSIERTTPETTTQVETQPTAEGDQVTIRSRSEQPTPTLTPIEAKWTRQEWPVDQELNLNEWWQDMMSDAGGRRLYLSGDGRHVAGGEIDAFLNSHTLVPNPSSSDDGMSCRSALDTWIDKARGHFIVSDNIIIPGGDNCHIFSNGN